MINNYIITKILGHAETGDKRYALLISLLDGIYVDAICKYVLACAKTACLKEYGCLSFAQILNKMDSHFCVTNAYDYVEFLQNDHEHLDEIYVLAR